MPLDEIMVRISDGKYIVTIENKVITCETIPQVIKIIEGYNSQHESEIMERWEALKGSFDRSGVDIISQCPFNNDDITSTI